MIPAFTEALLHFCFKPGKLTNEYILGKRKHFVQPIRLYLIFSFIYFFVSSLEVSKLTNQKELKGKIKNTTLSDKARKRRDSLKLNALVYQNYKINPGTLNDSLRKSKLSIVDSQRLATINAGFRAMQAQRQHKDSLNRVKKDSVRYYKRIKKTAKKLAGYRKELRNTDEAEEMQKYEDRIARYTKDSIEYSLVYQLKTNKRLYQDSLKRFVGSVQDSNRFVKMRVEADFQIDSIHQKRTKFHYSIQDSDNMLFGIDIQKVGELASLGFKEQTIMDSLDIKKTMISRLIVHQTIRWTDASLAQLIGYAVEKLPIVMFFVLPLFAFLLKLLYARRKRYYVEHIIFTLHIHSFAYLIFTFSILFMELLPNEIHYTLIVTFLLLFLYGYKSFRNVYKQGRFKTFVKIGIVGVAYVFILLITFTTGVLISLLLF